LPKKILYGVSNFEWLQNQEAVRLLLDDIWPILKKICQVPIKVWIVGRKMPEWIKNESLKDKDIMITENISDARDAYNSSTIMITPIRGGGGTRIKILEAMAAGLPVISTKIGVAGLNVNDGVNVFIADTANEISRKAKILLENEKLAEKIGENGRKHVRRYFDWRSIVRMHEPIYKELLKGKGNL
jgi:glycosyltransferase involved in cell wall biosynthesis